jgi:hypothetical protein
MWATNAFLSIFCNTQSEITLNKKIIIEVITFIEERLRWDNQESDTSQFAVISSFVAHSIAQLSHHEKYSKPLPYRLPWHQVPHPQIPRLHREDSPGWENLQSHSELCDSPAEADSLWRGQQRLSEAEKQHGSLCHKDPQVNHLHGVCLARHAYSYQGRYLEDFEDYSRKRLEDHL